MIRHAGDMWTAWEGAGLFLFTGNSVVSSAGKLVMGRGMALQVREKFHGIDKTLGDSILQCSEKRPEGLFYGLLVSPNWPSSRLGVFQVKYHWREDARYELIEESALALALWFSNHSYTEVHINYPGVDNGRLDYRRVDNIIAGIWKSMTIHVWTKD